MLKKIMASLLAVLLLAVGVISPRLIDSFDNLLEKFNYIVPANAPFVTPEDTRLTYRSGKIETDLKFKTVALTEKEAARIGISTAVEKDFVVKAETVDENQEIYNYEAYSWNVPFVKGTETDINTLGNANIKVGILDSGVSLSDEFEDVVRIDLVPDTIYDPLGIYNDVTGHGTGVAGVIAADKNNKGIIGIAPNVSVYSIRVLDENNEAPISRIIAGIEWAIENDIDVLNMSFGTENYSAQLYNAVRRAYENGIVLVASAGNTGGESEQVTYPAKFSEVIAVGACNENGDESDFSPNSTDVDILAPGEYINAVSLVDGYCVENGTSLAAPHISAAAALILSADNTKNPEFVKQLLVSTANVSQNPRGILDIKNALDTLPNFDNVETINPAQIPENTEEIENFEISEDVVVGNWWKSAHEDLIYTGIYGPDAFDDSDITEDLNEDLNKDGLLSQIDKENILIFARTAYLADVLYGYGSEDVGGNHLYRFAPLHALGHTANATSDDLSYVVEDGIEKSGMNSNYVADARYLFRLAKHFMNSPSVEYAASHMSNDYVPIYGANYRILRKIVASSEPIYMNLDRFVGTDPNGQEVEIVEEYNVKGIIHTDILWGIYPDTPERAGWAILGLAAHLIGDVFAHRTIIPATSITEVDGMFYLPIAPECFWGDQHEMWIDKNGDDVRNYAGNKDDFVMMTPNLTRLRYAMKEQVSYLSYYINTYNLCTCYHCLKELVAQERIEFRDMGPKFINRNIADEKYYNADRYYYCYEERYNIGTKKAISKLITQFCKSNGYCAIEVFMPDDENYTIKLNGLKKYIIDANVNYDNLTQTQKMLITKYSTGDVVL